MILSTTWTINSLLSMPHFVVDFRSRTKNWKEIDKIVCTVKEKYILSLEMKHIGKNKAFI
jgi:hypothetical protein